MKHVHAAVVAALLVSTGGVHAGAATRAGSAAGRSAPEALPAAAPTVVPRPVSSAPALTGSVIVKFRSSSPAATTTSAQQQAIAATGRRVGAGLSVARRLGTGAMLVHGSTPAKAASIAADLSARPDVEYAEPDRVLSAHGPNDPEFPRQWDLQASPVGIGIESAWTRATGAGVVVAVVDTGIRPHVEFGSRILPGYDFIAQDASARDGQPGRDSDARDPGDWAEAGDCGSGVFVPSSWHGTHVAGTIAATTGNGVGVAGIAPGASILPVRVLGKCGQGLLSDAADGIAWAVGATVAGVPVNPHPAKVVNLSLGGQAQCSATERAAVATAREAGAVVVTAAGNSATDAARFSPGNCPGVINVAASTTTGGRASFSNYGSVVALTAPGTSIRSAWNLGQRSPAGDALASMSGTSMAAPHVSGVAALVMAAAPGSTPDQVRTALTSSAKPFASACTGCGTGLLDATAALAAVTGATPTPSATPTPTPTPTPSPTGTASPSPSVSPIPTTPSPAPAAPPVVAGLSTRYGTAAGGTTVRLIGRNLSGASVVRFGANRATILNASATAVTVRTPALSPRTSTVVPVRVTTAAGTSPVTGSTLFRYVIPVPVATRLTPRSGPSSGGGTMVLTGRNLGTVRSVVMDRTTVPVVRLDSRRLSWRVPPRASSRRSLVRITLVTSWRTQVVATYRYTSVPSARAARRR